MKCSKKNSSDDPEEMCILFNLFERQADREKKRKDREGTLPSAVLLP